MTALYSLKTNSGTSNSYLSSISKFFSTGKVEIKGMSGLPVYLLNHKLEFKPDMKHSDRYEKDYIKYCDTSSPASEENL